MKTNYEFVKSKMKQTVCEFERFFQKMIFKSYAILSEYIVLSLSKTTDFN